MKKYILLLSLVGCAHHKKATDRDIDQYCQDLNVLYQKKAAIESNIANIHTTRTPEGRFYKKHIIHDCKNGFCKIELSSTPPLLKYEPNSPDANKNGYVAYPNISLAEEQYDLRQWENVFRNVVKFAPVKNSFFLKDDKAKQCFAKYPFVNENNNYRNYLGR
jgi:flagellar basal body rod protein FlgC